MKRKLLINLFFFGLILMNFFGCQHVPKNEAGKEKVILVHGYGRSPGAMESFKEFLEGAGYQVYSVGYSSMTQDIDGIKKEFNSKVDRFISSTDDTVHFVGHSMGGLMIRSYLGENKPNKLGNVVILGSPNKGTPLVELLRDKWYFSLGGPAVNSLSSEGSDFLSSLKKPSYNLGVIAGVVHRPDAQRLLPGKSDGLVPLESAKVDGAKDFLVMSVSHYMMRFDEKVMAQALHFIREASFNAQPRLRVYN